MCLTLARVTTGDASSEATDVGLISSAVSSESTATGDITENSGGTEAFSSDTEAAQTVVVSSATSLEQRDVSTSEIESTTFSPITITDTTASGNSLIVPSLEIDTNDVTSEQIDITIGITNNVARDSISTEITTIPPNEQTSTITESSSFTNQQTNTEKVSENSVVTNSPEAGTTLEQGTSVNQDETATMSTVVTISNSDASATATSAESSTGVSSLLGNATTTSAESSTGASSLLGNATTTSAEPSTGASSLLGNATTTSSDLTTSQDNQSTFEGETISPSPETENNSAENRTISTDSGAPGGGSSAEQRVSI